MDTFRTLVGHRLEADIHNALSHHEYSGRVVRLIVPQSELGRKRFKAVDQDGIEYGIALPRDVTLRDGSVLELTDRRAVVVEARETEQLHLRALDAEGGIQLGWHAGHLHWKVRMAGQYMTVLLDGPRDDYLVRIEHLLHSGVIEVVESEAGTTGAAVAAHEPHSHDATAHGAGTIR
ncbi:MULTISPECIES: urease accessory protein UreE [unclassified Dietzia]|uniref:urease accessory protein UreE n=1 Tax=unclassified Dietzia TaxID=2617939 RepID=UPI0015FA1B34|nr:MULTISPECIES: urease accessory protein UreE [unclassified Dietzia]MBB1043330.1 urease accessory protein UreE [Dietzia sp. DQ11-44]